MLIRVSGASEGIKDYLINGHKDGREFSRNELDERLVLNGDLELTDAIINSLTRSGERYLHITMSFREDEVDRGVLKAVTDEFKEFALAAYKADEFNLYAEAHLPRIKSYVHKRTGNLVERKPHIHLVIPEINLLSGFGLNPFGKVDRNTKFLEAFQEYINGKYGLASPKDHRRVEMTTASEMISRYKGDVFSGANTDLKKIILDEVMARGVDTLAGFKSLLAERGIVRSVRAGTQSEYQNLKLPGANKGLNLKEFVFSRDFIELPDADKRARLIQARSNEYQAPEPSRPTDRVIAARLREWHEIRSREIKYLNSGNAKLYQTYKEADKSQRRDILAKREANFYEKYGKGSTDHEQRQDRGGVDAFAREYPFKRAPGTERRQPDAPAARRESAPKSLNRVRGLSSLGVVRLAKRGEVLLPDHAPGELEHERAERADPLRRVGNRGGQRVGGHGGRSVDNLVGQLEADVVERGAAQEGQLLNDVAQIKLQLDARRLLEQLSHSHGVIPQKYRVSKGRDGGDRVACGSRNLNMADFLTKEMNLPWLEAEAILRECFASQLEKSHVSARTSPRSELWTRFRAELAGQHEASVRQRAQEAEQRAAIKSEFSVERGRILGDRGLSSEARRAAMSIARMAKVQLEQALREQIASQREPLQASRRKPFNDQYREFLVAQAQAGDVDALAELRRQRPGRDQVDADAPRITAVLRRQGTPALLPKPLLYSVDRDGNVTYQDALGRAALRDTPREVRMLQLDDSTIETGLRLAMQKFGAKVRANGDEDFKRRLVEISVARGFKVDFSDPVLNKLRADLEAARRGGGSVAPKSVAGPAMPAAPTTERKQPDHAKAPRGKGPRGNAR